MLEQLFAAIALAVCGVLLVRLCLNAPRRYRFDAWVRRSALAMRRQASALRHWRSSRRAAKQAAADAIERARRRVDRDGNVYTPKSFRKPPKDKMH